MRDRCSVCEVAVLFARLFCNYGGSSLSYSSSFVTVFGLIKVNSSVKPLSPIKPLSQFDIPTKCLLFLRFAVGIYAVHYGDVFSLFSFGRFFSHFPVPTCCAHVACWLASLRVCILLLAGTLCEQTALLVFASRRRLLTDTYNRHKSLLHGSTSRTYKPAETLQSCMFSYGARSCQWIGAMLPRP